MFKKINNMTNYHTNYLTRLQIETSIFSAEDLAINIISTNTNGSFIIYSNSFPILLVLKNKSLNKPLIV